LKCYKLKLTNGAELIRPGNPLICLQPDESRRMNQSDLTDRLNWSYQVKFTGPGMYLIHTGSKRSHAVDSWLIVPEQIAKGSRSFWKAKRHIRTMYVVYVWHSMDASQMLNVMLNAPTRHDSRP
jgi:hypothetical protein